MLKNYLKVAWRNLVKNKTSSFINVSGLSIGMAVSILIGLWIYEEFSFNKFHKNYDSIAQVMQHQHYNDATHTDKAIPIPLGTELRRAYGTDFKYVVLSSWTNAHLLTFEEKSLSRQGNFMEEDAPDMLTLEMISGSAGGLKDPSSILLSLSVSKALFGDDNAIGKIIKLDTLALKVTGVYEDLPDNTTFNNMAFIAPWNVYAAAEDNKNAGSDWNQNSFQLFAQVADNSSIAEVSKKIKDVKLKALGSEGARLKPQIFLQPMSRWHLYAAFKNGINTGGAIEYVWMFGIIGVFVLLLACINFMNLSTARSERRAKEVGIRKAVGSLRRQLIGQFYTESLLVAFIAFTFSLLMVQLSLPLFNIIAGKKMVILWDHPLFWLSSVGFSLITGFVAGSYPAMYLSSFRPVKVLKGPFKAGRFSVAPRKVLVVAQFTVSVILIIGTVIVYRQVQFAKNRPIGYNNKGLLLIRPYSTDFHDHFNAMRYDLMQTGVVAGVAESGSSITKGSRISGGFNWKGKDPDMQDEFTTVGVSTGYGSTVGWQFISGRDFSSQFATDSSALIINEAAVKYMGLEDPVGQTVTWNKTYTIIGVIKNIVMTSPYEPVKQAMYFITPEAGYLNIKIKPNAGISEALGKIEAVCKKYSPAAPFDYKFADEEYARKFNNEQRIGHLATVLSVLAIFISCLGLFGLASFVAEQRTKEIGVRKVLGASVFDLWRLQSKEFIVLVMVSLLIAIPAAYYFMYSWLENYQYRTNISWWIFAVTGSGALLITLLTVSYQSIRAALSNPVKSLRME
jgi:putative ABC transport system permease protein